MVFFSNAAASSVACAGNTFPNIDIKLHSSFEFNLSIASCTFLACKGHFFNFLDVAFDMIHMMIIHMIKHVVYIALIVMVNAVVCIG